MVRASSLRAISRSCPAVLHVGNLALERGTEASQRRSREGEERERPERRVPARHHAHFGMWLGTACLLLGRPRLYTPVPGQSWAGNASGPNVGQLFGGSGSTVISEAESGIAGSWARLS